MKRLKLWFRQATCRHKDGRIVQYNIARCLACGKKWTYK